MAFVDRQLATLALSHVQSPVPTALLRAATWHNGLLRLGVPVPLFLVHDLGLLLSQPRAEGAVTLGPQEAVLSEIGLRDEERAPLAAYLALLSQVADSEAVQEAAGLRIRDDLVAVLLARLLRPILLRWPDRLQWGRAEELPLDANLYAAPDRAALWRQVGNGTLSLGLLRHLTTQGLALLTGVEQIDLETLRLLGILRSDAASGLVDLVDLYHALSSVVANDVVNFSLELIPSILETKRSSGVQIFSMDGYASIERHGNLDSIMLSELGLDDDLFERKWLDQELYFYGHEKQRQEPMRLHYVLVDASASMRGVRQVFARGLALALTKKVSLQGDEVWLRFFDSRLHELVKVQPGGALQIPYLLCFQSERGRNYGRVFRQLASELARLRRAKRGSIVVYLLTHGQCHIPVEIVSELRALAFLYGIFVLPSQNAPIEYASLLHRMEVVDAETLANRNKRRHRALGILSNAPSRTERPG